MLTAHDVADYFLAQVSEEVGDNLSNLKLQKLLYYAQGFYLALNDAPLFPEEIKAWQLGPVVESIYQQYKQFGANAIPKPETVDFTRFDHETRDFLDEIFQVYGQFSAWKLSRMTHDEPPWKNSPPNEVISPVDLKSFFKTQLIEA